MSKTKGYVLATILMCMAVGGCDTLRLAPSEVQKQNTYLHHKTVQNAALQAQAEESSATLQELTRQTTEQSEAIVAYYGLPEELPPTNSIAEILSSDNQALTQTVQMEAVRRPDPWDVTDNLLEMGIGITGIFGGVCGARMLRYLQTARQKSAALREIVRGNELFKQNHPKAKTAFKQAQQLQSPATKQMVVELKES